MPIASGMTLLDQGIYNALTVSADLLSWCGGKNIYSGQAPANQSQGYVIYKKLHGSDENTSPRDAIHSFYLIVAVHTVKMQAMQGADYIDQALTGSDSINPGISPVLMPGWNVYKVFSGAWYEEMQNVQGVQYWMIGKQYGFMADRCLP